MVRAASATGLTSPGAAVLYYSLIPAGILVLLAHGAARRPPKPVRWGPFFGLGLPVVILTSCGVVVLPVAWFLLGTLAAALGVWAVRRHHARRFWPLSATAVVTAYGVAFLLFSAPQMRQSARLRQEFPFESMADRVPEPAGAGPLPAAAEGALVTLDEEVRSQAHRGWIRDRQLVQIHERTTDQFVSAPGFGVGRVAAFVGPPSRETLGQEWRGSVPDQPGPRGTSAGDADPPGDGEPVAAGGGLQEMHRAAALDFLNPEGWGLVKGRDRVAGFRPHRFSAVPDAKPKWEVETVELVGLLMHPEPVVYVSAKLPAMDQLRGAPTRGLDEFESAGLARLRAGEDAHAAGTDARVRMVASLRNGKACITCHGGRYGDLLGAFSYTLRAAKAP